MNQDSIRLLQECNAGAKMGVQSLNEVIDDACNKKLKDLLTKSRMEHEKLESKTATMLYRDDKNEKDPPMMASAMSWMKTNAKMAMDRSDQTIANIITDGCNMGVTSLNRYLNEFDTAQIQAKNVAKELITLEEKLCDDLKEYL